MATQNEKGESGESTSSTGEIPKTTIARRVLAGLVIVSGCTLAVTSIWFTPLRVCKDATGASNGAFVAIPACAPWSAIELIPFVVVALALILPDLSEVSVTNLFTLKRQVEAQKAEVDANSKRQDALEASISAQIQSLTSLTSQTVTTNILLDREQVQKLPQQVLTKSADLPGLAPRSVDAAADAAKARADMSRSELTVSLLKLWADMQPFVDYARNSRRLDYPLSAGQEESLRRWASLFKEEIQTVRVIRNSVAHASPVDDQTLKAGVETAQELTSFLQQLDLIRPE